MLSQITPIIIIRPTKSLINLDKVIFFQSRYNTVELVKLQINKILSILDTLINSPTKIHKFLVVQ